MPEQSNDYRVVVLGAAGVGKSSIIQRFVKGSFKESYFPTIEDIYRQVVASNKHICTLQITDTTGTHQFPAMQRLNIAKGHAFILVYSVTSLQSLDELSAIYDMIVNIKCDDMDRIPLILVGNKIDEVGERTVMTDIAQKQAKVWGCAFLETSAKSDHNITEVFESLLKLEKRRHISLQSNEIPFVPPRNGDTLKRGKSSQKRRDRFRNKCNIV